MGVMDKFLNYMKLNGEDDEEYYDDDYLDDEEIEPAPAPRRVPVSKARDMDEYEEERMSPSSMRRQAASSSKITPLMEKLGIVGGECTPDGKFSLDACRCVGACGLAPVMMINDEVYGRLTVDDIDDILAKYEEKV